MYSKSNINGTIYYERGLIQSIAGNAATSCYGVVEMASQKRVQDFIFSSSKGDYLGQGIVVKSYDHGVIDLDVHVVLGYSIHIKSIGQEIKKRVRYEVESNLNIRVRNIAVYVDAIDNVG